MTEYYYVGSTVDGNIVRGTQPALGKRHLIRQLAERRLFLIYWREKSLTPQLPEERSSFLISRLSLTPRLTWGITLRAALFKQRDIQIILAVTFLICFYGIRLIVPSPTVSVLPPQELRSKIYGIRIGQTREEVEKMFGRSPDSHTWDLTSYAANANTWFEVPYDKTGGEWNARNLVKGPVRMHVVIPGASIPAATATPPASEKSS